MTDDKGRLWMSIPHQHRPIQSPTSYPDRPRSGPICVSPLLQIQKLHLVTSSYGSQR
jgi:hypothetical protein